MSEQYMQSIATDITLISIALLASTLVVIGHIWKKFLYLYEHSSLAEWDAIRVPAFISILGLIVVSAIMMFGGSIHSNLLPVVIVVTSVVFCLIVVTYTHVRAKDESPDKRDGSHQSSLLFAYSIILFLFGFTIASLAISMMTSVGTALDIGQGPYEQSNFEGSRWTLGTAVVLFTAGLATLAYAKVIEFLNLRRSRERDNARN